MLKKTDVMFAQVSELKLLSQETFGDKASDELKNVLQNVNRVQRTAESAQCMYEQWVSASDLTGEDFRKLEAGMDKRVTELRKAQESLRKLLPQRMVHSIRCR